MATTHVDTDASPDAVFAVLADPWQYPLWVVGTRRIRYADDSWPATGSRFAHAVGAGPLELRDSTTVVHCEAPERLVLRAAFRPAGEACVAISIHSNGGRTRIVLREWPVAGPARRWKGWALETATYLRNVAALRRLRRLAERHEPAPLRDLVSAQSTSASVRR